MGGLSSNLPQQPRIILALDSDTFHVFANRQLHRAPK
jgi:hypothetical protein